LNLFDKLEELAEKVLYNVTGKIKGDKGLNVWRPVADDSRIVEDVIFVRNVYDITITDYGNEAIKKYAKVIYDLLPDIGSLQVENLKPNVAFGMFILYRLCKWIEENKDEIFANDLNNYTDTVLNFIYLVNYLHKYFNGNKIYNSTNKTVLKTYRYVEKVWKNIKHKRNDIYINRGVKGTEYHSYKVLIDTGSPTNFMSLYLAMFLNGKLTDKITTVAGFTSIQTREVSIYPVAKVRTIVRDLDEKTGNIIEFNSYVEYGIIPMFWKFINTHVLVGFDFLNKLDKSGIVTVIDI